MAERRDEPKTVRQLAERIVELSSNVHSEQISRLRAIHVLSEAILDALDTAPRYSTKGVRPRMDAYGIHRLIPDPETDA